MLSLKLRLGILSTPSGTLTLLRLTSSSAEWLIKVWGGGALLRRVTGGMYVPQSRLKEGSLLPLYC